MKLAWITIFILSLGLAFLGGGVCQFLLMRAPQSRAATYHEEVSLKIPKDEKELRRMIMLTKAQMAILEELAKDKRRQ